jgi:Kef-type K+ transport system membrane component KefB
MSDLLPVLAIALVGGRLAATGAVRFGLPGVFGELMLGLLLGPIIVRWMSGGETIETLGQIGVLVLMLLIGLETDLTVVKSVGKPAFLVAFLGAITPIIAGTAVARWMGEANDAALFIGVALAATSVSITAVTLRELGKLDSTAGRTILFAAVIDDILVLLFVSMVGESNGDNVGVASLRVCVYLLLAGIVGGFALKPALSRLEGHVDSFLAVAVGFGLLSAWAAERIGGLAGITGAYIAGLLLARALPEQPLAHGVEALATGFFATIFFVSLGLHVEVGSVSPSLLVLLGLLAVATKVFGGSIGARIAGLGRADSIIVGTGMVPRGEVALIVASIGFNRGNLSSGLFSLLVLVVIFTTVVTPLLLKAVYAVVERGLPMPVVAPRVLSDGGD